LNEAKPQNEPKSAGEQAHHEEAKLPPAQPKPQLPAPPKPQPHVVAAPHPAPAVPHPKPTNKKQQPG